MDGFALYKVKIHKSHICSIHVMSGLWQIWTSGLVHMQKTCNQTLIFLLSIVLVCACILLIQKCGFKFNHQENRQRFPQGLYFPGCNLPRSTCRGRFTVTVLREIIPPGVTSEEEEAAEVICAIMIAHGTPCTCDTDCLVIWTWSLTQCSRHYTLLFGFPLCMLF